MRLIAALLASTLSIGSPDGLVQLLPAGKFAARDGRPAPGKHWSVSDERGRAIAAEMSAVIGQTPIVIDYDHQTLHVKDHGAKAPAAGWMQAVEWRDGAGLFAKVEWTSTAKAHILAGEYRYISPVFLFDQDSGEISSVVMAALVNFPGLLGMEPVVAALSSLTPSQRQETHTVDLLQALIASLGLAAGADQAAVLSAVEALKTKLAAAGKPAVPAALATELGLAAGADEAAVLSAVQALKKPDTTATATIAALQGQVAALSAQINGDKLASMVDQAMKDGKLLPAQKDWALELGKKDLAALSGYLASAPVLTGLAAHQSGGAKSGNGGAAALATDPQALQVAANMGISAEAWAKAQEKRAA